MSAFAVPRSPFTRLSRAASRPRMRPLTRTHPYSPMKPSGLFFTASITFVLTSP